MAVKASNQVTVLDLTDGYSIVMTNEATTWLGSTNAVSKTQTATTQITALCGSEIVPCAVGTITCPTGISAVSDGKSPSPTVTVTATTALKTNGDITIPIIVNGGEITLSKKFSWSIAFTGPKGEKGDTGETGDGIDKINITYQKSTSGADIPSGTWSASIPTVNAGEYLWTRAETIMTSGSKSYSYTIGQMGKTGPQGKPGATGNGVKETTITYQVGKSGQSVPTGTWLTTIPAVPEGQFLWTRTVQTFTDGTKSEPSYSIGMMGKTGPKGDDAITISVLSSNGLVFKNTAIATTLTAYVYKSGAPVTGDALKALGTIKWYKDDNTTAIATGETLTISAGDVDSRASYIAKLEG